MPHDSSPRHSLKVEPPGCETGLRLISTSSDSGKSVESEEPLCDRRYQGPSRKVKRREWTQSGCLKPQPIRMRRSENLALMPRRTFFHSILSSRLTTQKSPIGLVIPTAEVNVITKMSYNESDT